MRVPALYLTAALTALTPAASHAQVGGLGRVYGQDAGVELTWTAVRLPGTWENESVSVTFRVVSGGVIYADAYLPKGDGTKRWLNARLIPNAAKTGMEGEWDDVGAYNDRWQGGRWKVSFVNDRVVVEGLPTGRNFTSTLRPVTGGETAIPDKYKDWLGEWTVQDGVLKLFMEQGRLMGTFRVPAASGLMETRREVLFRGATDRYETDGDTLVGFWQAVGDTQGGGEARMTLLPGKRSFGGTLSGDPRYGAWRGERSGAMPRPTGETAEPETLPAPTPVPQPPAPPEPRPVPQTPAPTVPQPEPAADGFEPLGKWDVRIDKVENPRDDRLTHVYVTLRNAGTQNLLQTEDVWVYLETSDGLTQRSGQGLRALPGPAQLFGSPPPVVLPGKEIKAKYIFDRHRGVTLTSIMVMEGDHKAEFAF